MSGPIAINIRGTGGSGKSTLAKRLMALYPAHANIMEAGRKKPMATVHWVAHLNGGPSAQPGVTVGKGNRVTGTPRGLLVPGHYETACGGCDTVKTVDKVYELVRATTLGDGNNALYEGIMVQDDVTRAVAFDQELKKVGGRLIVLSLNTDIEVCLSSIRERRAVAGNEKPLNEKNTRSRDKSQENSRHRLKQAGVQVLRLGREDGYQECARLLGFPIIRGVV